MTNACKRWSFGMHDSTRVTLDVTPNSFHAGTDFAMHPVSGGVSACTLGIAALIQTTTVSLRLDFYLAKLTHQAISYIFYESLV